MALLVQTQVIYDYLKPLCSFLIIIFLIIIIINIILCFQQMGSRTSVSCLSISPCTKVVTSGQNDNTISLWDTATQCRKHILFGHTGINKIVYNHFTFQLLCWTTHWSHILLNCKGMLDRNSRLCLCLHYWK